MAALIYARPANGESSEPYYRISLRSSSDGVSMQEIAREKGGGGHRQAAGFSSSGESPSELARFLSERVEKALEDL